MKIPVIFSLLLFLPIHVIAEAWDYELKDMAAEKIDEEGNKSYFVKAHVIDYYIDRIAAYAENYPPSFKDKNEKDEIVGKLERLIGMLEIISKSQRNNPEFLARAAFTNSMGHNVDLKGSYERANSYYKNLLSITPDSPTANYRYGLFLAETRERHFESISYLGKALKLGQKDARYALGLLYFHQGKKEKALSMLKKFSLENPNNGDAKMIIENINSGKLKFKSN